MYNLKIGCKCGRRTQACIFGYPQSQEKCKYSRQRNYFDIFTPVQSFAPSNKTHCLSVMAAAVRCENWSVEKNSAILRMERLSLGITGLSIYFIEGAIYSTSVCEAALSFFLLLVCSRNQRNDVNKGQSTEQPLRLQDFIWSQAQPHICGWAYLVRPKDSEMISQTVDWWISDYMSWSSEPNAFKKEVKFLGRGFAPSVDCICMRVYGFYTVFLEKWLK